MLKFVNAKINIGLNIVGKREDGYHLLQTCFLPIGLRNGTPQNPQPFNDCLELTDGHLADNINEEAASYSEHNILFRFYGRPMNCPAEKNLIVKAVRNLDAYLYSMYQRHITDFTGPLTLCLTKNIPDGAGMGGGSADATFTLKLLNDRLAKEGVSPLEDTILQELAVKLGADCAVFVKNRPIFAEGIGEIFSPLESPEITSMAERGRAIAIIKPNIHISTRDAFAGIKIAQPEISLREALSRPIKEWKYCIFNDFEASLFPKYPQLKELKENLYNTGADYASMTGSGAALYGIYKDYASACRAIDNIRVPYRTVCLPGTTD